LNHSFYVVDDYFKKCSDLIDSIGDVDKVILLTDSNIFDLYKNDIKKLSDSLGYEFSYKIIKPGEDSKSIANFIPLTESILEYSISRKSLLIAFGGGVIGDIVGFLASVILRGVRYINIPTSLIAQVDSCIGGKTGLNSKLGKNLIGSFYAPINIIISPKLLLTLSDIDYFSGYAEIVKHAILEGEELLTNLENNIEYFLNKDIPYLNSLIETSLKIKIKIIDNDFLEQNGKRILLNFGHSFAHALESYFANFCQDIKISHGEAVIVGMVLAFKYSHMIGLLENEQEISRIINLVKKIKYDLIIEKIYQANIEIPNMINFFKRDKKNNNNQIILLLPKKIGDIRCMSADINILSIFLKEQCCI
jgi:3-dehydroquinate synthase